MHDPNVCRGDTQHIGGHLGEGGFRPLAMRRNPSVDGDPSGRVDNHPGVVG